MTFHANNLDGFQVIERSRLREGRTDSRDINNMSPPLLGAEINIYTSMKFHENIFNGFQDIEGAQNYNCRTSEGNNSKKVLTRVTVLKLCTSSDDAFYFCEVSLKSLKCFLSYRADTKYHCRTKMYIQELQFLSPARRLIKFHENTLNDIRIIERKRNYHCRTSEGNNSIKVLTRVTVLKLCTSSDDALYFYEVSLKSLKCFLSYRADTKYHSRTNMYIQELQYLSPARRLMMFYILIKFHENTLNGIRVIERKRNYHCRTSKGNNCNILQTRNTVFVFCTSSVND